MVLIERVFRQEELNQDKRVCRSDIDAMEKEISIDIAELRRDLRTTSAELCSQLTTLMEKNNPQQHITDIASNKVDREKITINRQSRKNNILNEASYLATRLSRALSNNSAIEEDEKQGEKNNSSPYMDEKRMEEKPLDLENGKNIFKVPFLIHILTRYKFLTQL